LAFADSPRRLASSSKAKIEKVADKSGKRDGTDDYTYAHLAEAAMRIDKALDATYIYNTNDFSSGGFGGNFFFQPVPPASTRQQREPNIGHYGLESEP